MSDVKLVDNVPEIKNLIGQALENALERCGMMAEAFAKKNCPHDTGQLRNSITHEVVVSDRSVYVGSNMEYAPYVELGTGIYATEGGGRDTPWVYQDAKGEYHRTSGSPAQPFLKPAVDDHADIYRTIFEQALKYGV